MKKLVFLTMMFGLMMIFGGSASAQDCNPNDNQVAVYEHGNYRGKCAVLNVGDYATGRAGNFTNKITSSVKVGKNVSALLCRDVDFKGICETFESDNSLLTPTKVGNDQVSSIKVMAKNNSASSCEPKDGEVAIFEHIFSQNGGGKCKILKVGDYNNPTKMGLTNDTMSSIKVGKGVTAMVCRDFDFKGPCEIFASNDADLTKNPVIKNDMASSIKVTNARACSPSSDKAVSLKWVNKTGKPIRVNWIGFDCKEQTYRVIQPNAVFEENSYVGHIFRVRDDSNTDLGLMVATPDNLNFEIK